MAVYLLINAATQTGTAPSPTNPPQQAQQGAPGNPWAIQGPSNPNSPTQSQCFILTASATSGNVSATATIVASNDGQNWAAPASNTVSVSGAPSGSSLIVLAVPAKHFAAYLSTLTGTGATATLTMSA